MVLHRVSPLIIIIINVLFSFFFIFLPFIFPKQNPLHKKRKKITRQNTIIDNNENYHRLNHIVKKPFCPLQLERFLFSKKYTHTHARTHQSFELAFFWLHPSFSTAFFRVHSNDEIRLSMNGRSMRSNTWPADDVTPCFRFCLSRHRLMSALYVPWASLKRCQTSRPRGNLVNRANK